MFLCYISESNFDIRTIHNNTQCAVKAFLEERVVRYFTAMIMLVGMTLISGCSNMNYSKPPGQTSGSIQGDFYGPGANRALQTVVWAENQRLLGYPRSHMVYGADYIPASAWGPAGQIILVEEDEPQTQELLIRIDDGSVQSAQVVQPQERAAVTEPQTQERSSTAPANNGQNADLERRVGHLEGQVSHHADEIVRVEREYKAADVARGEWTAEMFQEYYEELDRRVNGP